MISGRLDIPPGMGSTSTSAQAYGPAASRHAQGPFIVLAQGEPMFLDADIASVAAAQGQAAAWRALYERAGEAAPQRVHGRFACAILDEVAGTAFLAVDRFGIDSLCYTGSASGLAFATRADEVPMERDEIDPQAVFDYLYFHMIPSPRTIRRGVLRVPPAHSVSFRNGSTTVRRYWQPSFEEPGQGSVEALREEFLALLEASVARAAGSGLTGTFLSGGTDSSTVAGMLGRAQGRPAQTYSIGFDKEGYDEMAFARIAAKHFGTEHHEYYVTPDDLVAGIPVVIGELDQPFGNSSVLPAWCCARMAKDDGISRLLAGDGGDELFGGNTRYAKQRVFELYGMLPGMLRRGLIEPGVDHVPGMGRLPLVKKAVSYVEQARVPMPDRVQMYNLLHRIGIGQLLEPAFASSIDSEGPLRQQRECYRAIGASSLINRMLAYDWKYTLADNDLPKVIAATRTAGMATSFPLLDQSLVDFSMRLAPSLKLKGFKLRYFFKEALRGFLPDEIITKKKHGFGLPFGHWAVAPGPLRDFVMDSLTAFKSRGYVRAAYIDELVSRDLPAYPGYYGELVWIMMMLEQWLRRPAPVRDRSRASP